MNEPLALNGTYRLKAEVLNGSAAIDGKPLDADVTIVHIKTRPGYKTRIYFDARGNAYRAKDFAKKTEVIEVEL